MLTILHPKYLFVQIGDLVNLPDGRLFLCNGAQQGMTMLHIHILHPAALGNSEM